MTKPLVIIGTGLGGYSLAKEFRKLDMHRPLVLITQDAGRFYSKPLLSTALTNQKTEESLAVYQAAQMAEQLAAKIYTYSTVKSIDIKQQQLECVINNNIITIDYSQLVLACGAKPIAPKLHGDAAESICSINNLIDYGKFRDWLAEKKHIAILGAGLVGCEFTNDLANAGFRVSAIDVAQYPLPKLVPQQIGQQLQRAFAAKGISWHLGNGAEKIDRQGIQFLVKLVNGAQIIADGVLSAIGLKPNLELAQKANLKINQGIVVNRYLQTSDQHIYALGDCAEVAGHLKMYVAPLLQCARALAKTLVGEATKVEYPTMPVVIKTPTCPVVSAPPPADVFGEWRFEGDGINLRALYYDQENILRGFVLIGSAVRDRMQLARQVPLVFFE